MFALERRIMEGARKKKRKAVLRLKRREKNLRWNGTPRRAAQAKVLVIKRLRKTRVEGKE